MQTIDFFVVRKFLVGCWKDMDNSWKQTRLIRQDNTIYKFSIQLSFSSIGQDKSKLQKQMSKLLILNETAA